MPREIEADAQADVGRRAPPAPAASPRGEPATASRSVRPAPPPAAPATSARPSQRAGRQPTQRHAAHAAGARRRARRSRAQRQVRPQHATRPCAALDRLNAWIARARDVGIVAIDTETTSLDPMQADAVRHLARGRAERGLLRAARPSQGGDGGGGDLFAGRTRARPDRGARRARPR